MLWEESAWTTISWRCMKMRWLRGIVSPLPSSSVNYAKNLVSYGRISTVDSVNVGKSRRTKKGLSKGFAISANPR